MENVSRNVKLTEQLLIQLDFQKMDRHTGGKWIIQGTKHYMKIYLNTYQPNLKQRKTFLAMPNLQHNSCFKFGTKEPYFNMWNLVF